MGDFNKLTHGNRNSFFQHRFIPGFFQKILCIELIRKKQLKMEGKRTLGVLKINYNTVFPYF